MENDDNKYSYTIKSTNSPSYCAICGLDMPLHTFNIIIEKCGFSSTEHALICIDHINLEVFQAVWGALRLDRGIYTINDIVDIVKSGCVSDTYDDYYIDAFINRVYAYTIVLRYEFTIEVRDSLLCQPYIVMPIALARRAVKVFLAQQVGQLQTGIEYSIPYELKLLIWKMTFKWSRFADRQYSTNFDTTGCDLGKLGVYYSNGDRTIASLASSYTHQANYDTHNNSK